MKNSYSILILLVQFLCFSFNINPCLGGDTISVNESVSSGHTIISSGGKFELGFFTPGDSNSYYIGIWYYKVYPQTVVWVANRDKPLDSADDAILIVSQGTLVLIDRLQNSIWSPLPGNIINPNSSVTAVLHDDGNLILSDVSKASTALLLWQSFDHPTDTILPGAKLGYEKRTQRKQVLISWKNLNDPAPGLYSLEMDPKHAQIVIKWNRTTEYWASGSWNGQGFTEIRSNDMFNYSYIDNENVSYFTYSLYFTYLTTTTSRLIMDVSGQIMQQMMESGTGWRPFWIEPGKLCEVYSKCGAFGVCDEANETCNCLSGFKQRSDTEWNSDDYSSGCVRDQKV